MKLLAALSLIIGTSLLVALTVVSISGSRRDAPGDGLKARQTLVATVLGYERDEVCRYGDDGERSTEECRTCDDGRYHPHWICDQGTVIRPASGRDPVAGHDEFLKGFGNGAEVLIALALTVVGGFGLYRRWDD